MIDQSGPRIVEQSPALQASAPFNHLTIIFDEAIDSATFTLASIARFTGPGGVDLKPQLLSVSGSGTTYTIAFNNQSAQGIYTLEIAPTIRDLANNLMDQDDDGILGEIADRYIATVNLQSPDLVVQAVTGPSATQFGNLVNVTWRVRNRGADPAVSGWSDQLWLSTDAVLDGNDVSLALLNASDVVPLAADATYDRSVSIRLPLTVNLAAGDYYILVKIDALATQPETNEANNIGASERVRLTLPSVPDLLVSEITAPAIAFSNQRVNIQWTVANLGSGAAAGSRVDQVFLSSDNAIGGDQLLGSLTYSDTIPSGSTLSRSLDVTLPNVTGQYWIVVRTDATDTIEELFNDDNNTTIDDRSTELQVRPLPDLTISAATVSPNSADFGSSVSITWTVVNLGTAVAAATRQDRIYLSRDALLDGTDIVINTVAVPSDPLAVGSSYTRLLGINLPLIAEFLDGNYFILVRTDVTGSEQESNETNNIAATGIALTLPKLPDLAVTSIIAARTGQPGENTSISWTVENRGDAPATASWSDSVYLTASGTTAGARLLATLARPASLAVGASYTVSRNFALPEIAGGDYRILVVSDVTGAVFESNLEANNSGLSAEALELRHADVLPSNFSAPTTATSGMTLALSWNTTNRGVRPTLRGWQDNVYLSTDSTLSANDVLLGTYTRNTIAAPGEVTPIAIDVSLPLNAAGNYFLLVKSDSSNVILEGVDEANNVLSRPLAVNLAPYADLTVSQVNGPGLVIGDPATLTVSWTVSNSGTGRGITDTWTDAVIASTDSIVGNSDDRVLARFTHTGGLNKDASYSRTESFLAPPAYTGQYHLYVKTDSDQLVFENASELNNTNQSDELLQIMPIPYADLVVSSIALQGGGALGFAFSGQPYEFTWTSENRGLGTTNIGTWIDRVELATDAAGTNRIAELGDFEHFGHLAVGEHYTRTGIATLPNGLSGTYYLVVTTAKRNGPFEFVYGNNNTTVSTAIPVTLTIPPDLTVTHVSAPPVADEGDFIDVSWTIRNVGVGSASGTWVDQVFLRKAGDPSAPSIEVGQFRYTGRLAANTQYVRSEAVRLPSQVNDTFNVFVRTNFEEELYEHGATGNNLRAADNTVLVRVLPRPDLQVDQVIAPTSVAAGGTISVSFSIINQGSVATNVPQWVDRVYLSLDNKLTLDDILLDEIDNQSALAPGERYRSTTVSGNVPERYRGEVFLLVVTDATDKIGEWPNNENNLSATPVYVNPLPLADLIEVKLWHLRNRWKVLQFKYAIP